MAAMGGFATILAHILAHQGGWDEALMVLGPLIIIGLLLRLANRRADKVSRNTEDHDQPRE